jgi:hypothetical protein
VGAFIKEKAPCVGPDGRSGVKMFEGCLEERVPPVGARWHTRRVIMMMLEPYISIPHPKFLGLIVKALAWSPSLESFAAWGIDGLLVKLERRKANDD